MELTTYLAYKAKTHFSSQGGRRFVGAVNARQHTKMSETYNEIKKPTQRLSFTLLMLHQKVHGDPSPLPRH